VLRRAVALAAALAAGAVLAQGAPHPTGLVPLRQLTSGASDQFFGQLHPDGRTLYFASNANGTIELLTQPVDGAAPTLLFDEQADVSQPRLSPDGSRVLYVSYRSDAFGDACVVDTAGGGRRCVGAGGAVLHACWFPDSRHVGVVTRAELGGRHQLRRVAVDGPGDEAGVVLLEGYFSGPVVSPDGRWLAAVTLAPSAEDGGAALLRATRGLSLFPLAGGEPLVLQPELPGASAFPAFSADGQWLYFTQFPDDSNADGVTDGNDNGVLARVPWRAGDATPADGAAVQVLTSQRHNCQYPMPAKDRLIATCNRRGALQLVSLPLEGEVPPTLSQAQLDAEADAARHRWERLLLEGRSLELERAPRRRVALERRLAMAHLELGAFDSAEFELGLMSHDAGADDAEAAWAAVAIELVRHRRDEARLGFSKLSDEFVARERARLEALEAREAAAPLSAARLAQVVRAEVLRVLGRKAEALALFDRVALEAEEDADVVLLWGRLAEVLLREYDDRERWARALLRVARHTALSARERLLHARRFVDVLARGRGVAERLEAYARARPLAPAGSDAELLLDVEEALDRVARDAQAAALPALDSLWRRAPDFEARRVVAMTVIQRAAHDDLEVLLDEYARRWLDEVPDGHPERKYAEALFAEALLEHAYVELRQQRLDAAAGLFLDIARRARSLEAVGGYVDAALRAGAALAPLLERLEAALGGEAYAPLRAYGRAVALGRGLSSLGDDALRATVAQARAALAPAIAPLARAPELHHLLGHLAHEEFHRLGDRPAALEAHARYHFALDLSPDVYRRRASLLLELGLLQAALGNHRIALKHFDERARLPRGRPAETLAFHLARARSLYHAQAAVEAAEEAARGVALVEEHAELAPFRPLALERAMFCELAAGRHEAALAHGEALLPRLPPSAAAQVKARLALASALLSRGRPADARVRLAEARAALEAPLPLHTADALAAHGPTHLAPDDLRALVEGVDAEAARALGDDGARLSALEAREAALVRRQGATPQDDAAATLARTSHDLARTAARLGRWDEARAHLRAGLARARAGRPDAASAAGPTTVALLSLCAEVLLERPDACPLPRAEVVAGLEAALEQARREGFIGQPRLRWSLPVLLTRLAP
jgi:Tol biopolymer transport system component